MQQSLSFSICKAVCLAFLATLGHRGYSEEFQFTWQRWEHTLISKRSYSQPYNEISLLVTYTGPGGESFTQSGFWDNDNVYKIRSNVSPTWQMDVEIHFCDLSWMKPGIKEEISWIEGRTRVTWVSV